MSKKLFKYALLSWGMVSAVGQAMGSEADSSAGLVGLLNLLPTHTLGMSKEGVTSTAERHSDLRDQKNSFLHASAVKLTLSGGSEDDRKNAKAMLDGTTRYCRVEVGGQRVLYDCVYTPKKLENPQSATGASLYEKIFCGSGALIGTFMMLAVANGRFQQRLPSLLMNCLRKFPDGFGLLGLALWGGSSLAYGMAHKRVAPRRAQEYYGTNPILTSEFCYSLYRTKLPAGVTIAKFEEAPLVSSLSSSTASDEECFITTLPLKASL